MKLDAVHYKSNNDHQTTKVPTSKLLPFYFLYLLFQLLIIPLLIIVFFFRLFSKSGMLWLRKLAGGTLPPKPFEYVVFVGHGFGEARKAIQCAQEITQDGKHLGAVWVEYPVPFLALSTNDHGVPIGLGPLNNPISVYIALRRWRPKALIFIQRPARTNIGMVARLMGVTAMVANVNISERRIRIKKRQLFPGLSHILTGHVGVQGDVHKKRLIEIGVPESTIRVFGPPFSRLYSQEESKKIHERWRLSLGLIDKPRTVIVAGSTREGEEEIVLEAFKKMHVFDQTAMLVLAPRQLERIEEVERQVERCSLQFERKTALSDANTTQQVLLLDTYGDLAEAYSIATVAFVGGTFLGKVGGHSLHEPAYWGVAITIGPHFGTQEASVEACLASEILTICNNADDLSRAWKKYATQIKESKLKAEELIERQSHIYSQWVDSIA